MKILSKIISFAAFLLSIILIFIILTSCSQLDEDYILKIIIVYFGLFFIRLFLIPRLAERIEKKKRQTVKLQEQREQQIKKYPKIDIIIYVLVGVQVAFCLAGFICNMLYSHFEYGKLFLRKYSWFFYSMSGAVDAILAFILPPELLREKEDIESQKEDSETQEQDEDTE